MTYQLTTIQSDTPFTPLNKFNYAGQGGPTTHIGRGDRILGRLHSIGPLCPYGQVQLILEEGIEVSDLMADYFNSCIKVIPPALDGSRPLRITIWKARAYDEIGERARLDIVKIHRGRKKEIWLTVSTLEGHSIYRTTFNYTPEKENEEVNEN